MNVLLTILDGWGISKKIEGNAIALAKAKRYLRFLDEFPNTSLKAHGEAVGLLKGYIGSSKVGHLNIGCGRIVKQDLKIIHDMIKNNILDKKELKDFINKHKEIHFIGLCSDGGVHSHINHIIAAANLAKKYNKKIYIHCILDGRDTAPKSARKFLSLIEKNGFKIASLIGRYYAMDRDKRWDRTKKAYCLYKDAKGKYFENWKKAIAYYYQKGISDEFIEAVKLKDFKAINDAVVFCNFRADRMRQIVKAIRGEIMGFKKINADTFTFIPYYDEYKGKYLYKFENIKNSLGEIISKKGLRQLRIAESEKYAHVTYFFSGKRERPFKNEERIIIDSPKVSTYDKKPEMSAYKITNEIIKAFDKKYSLIVNNFANADMVGHTGNLKATIKAIRHLDNCFDKIYKKIDLDKWTWFITADHGNAEEMLKNNKIVTKHSKNKVPLIIISKEKIKLKTGVLGNVAPSILEIMKIKKANEMIESLIR